MWEVVCMCYVCGVLDQRCKFLLFLCIVLCKCLRYLMLFDVI